MDQSAIEDNELVIVGSRYKDLADVFCEYYETGKPLEHDDLVRILGSDRVMLLPVRNTYDYYAVEVRTTDRKLLAHIWMYQSYAVREWMNDHEMKCMQARVTRINTRYGLIFAEPVDAADLVISGRCNINIDESWARGLPDFYQSNDSQSLSLSLYMLHDELPNAEGWNNRLETRMLNLLQDLLSDLSAEYYDECMELYYMMKHSPIAGIREQSDRLLDGYVRRASIDNMTWWRRVWLPQYIQDVAESDVPRMFELAGYDLQSVEALLHRAPEGLSYLYEANPERFAYHLYYSTLSRDVYTRLLTLIAVRQVMREKGGKSTKESVESVEKMVLDKELFARAIENCQQYFWGSASYAVVFCIYRDDFEADITQTGFEEMVESLSYKKKRDYCCPVGTIANAFRHNPIFKTHISRWESQGASFRILKLVKMLRKELEC